MTAAADPGATIGTIGAPLMPGMSRSMTFTVDTAANRFFSFAPMVPIVAPGSAAANAGSHALPLPPSATEMIAGVAA